MDSLSSTLPLASVGTQTSESGQNNVEGLSEKMIGKIFSRISLADHDTLRGLALVSRRILDQVGVASLKSYFLAAEQAFALMPVARKIEMISNLSAWLVNVDDIVPLSDLENLWGRLQILSGSGCMTLFEELDSLKCIMVSLRQSRFLRTDEGQAVHRQLDQAIRISVTNISILMEDTSFLKARR